MPSYESRTRFWGPSVGVRSELGESDPVRELEEVGGRLSAGTDQGGDGFADGGVAAGVLRCGLAGLPVRGDCLVAVPCPAVGACRFDVEVGAALGGQGARGSHCAVSLTARPMSWLSTARAS